MALKHLICICIAAYLPFIQSGVVNNNVPSMMFTQGNILLGDPLGGNGIRITNGTINCGNLHCPPHAFRCSISQRTTPNTSYVMTERNCTNARGDLCAHKSTTEANTFPGTIIRTYATASLSGGIVTCTNCNGINTTQLVVAQQAVLETVGGLKNQTTSSISHRIKKAARHMGSRITSAAHHFGHTVAHFGDAIKHSMHNMMTHFQFN